VDVRQRDVTDARSIRDAITEGYKAIFFTEERGCDVYGVQRL